MDQYDIVRVSYNEALRSVFQVGLIVSCISLFGAATLEWKSINKVQSGLDTETKPQMAVKKLDRKPKQLETSNYSVAL